MLQPPKEVPETAVLGVRFWMPRARMGSLARQCLGNPHTNRQAGHQHVYIQIATVMSIA
jgi:hypothetical protein